MQNCLTCGTQTSNLKFCSRSCAAKTNNKQRLKPRSSCPICGKIVVNRTNTYCSQICSSSRHRKTDAEKRLGNAIRQSRYRAKGYRALAEDADPQKIREFYLNCPEGCEVDHIHPLSLGGKHHEDNLQYLPWRKNRSKSNRYIG